MNNYKADYAANHRQASAQTPEREVMADFMTARQVTELLQVDRTTVYRMAERGSLPARKVGGQWRFPRTQIEAWLATDAHTSAHVTGPHVTSGVVGSELRTALPLACVQLIQDTFAQILGIGLMITDLAGVAVTQPSNQCDLHTFALAQDARLAARLRTHYVQCAQHPGNQPAYRADLLGLHTAQARVTVAGENVALVIATGIAPADWPPPVPELARLAQTLGIDAATLAPWVDAVFTLDAQAQTRTLDALPRLADIVAHVLQERNQFRTTLQNIAELAKI